MTSTSAKQPMGRRALFQSALGAGIAGVLAVASAPPAFAAVNYYGLTTDEWKSLQRLFRDNGISPGAIDGVPGTNTWKAMQRFLILRGQNPGVVDGQPGPNTWRAIQRFLTQFPWYSVGPVDGIPGPQTRAALKQWANLAA
ncbi:peptidoglycan-binding protein [Rathayibacter tanaceti]|uniref:Peptidoglycan-binding protein n=2 Tax=Rathayibacter tanaceti TaxID=1671680 RepID=A0A166I9B3_9MICO|nr:peptidoglycan-binding domain-containing protein [Rathayibacter tanaceti]KZX21985.1 putative peptidoglycan binding domain protein [Rathayibacter tanaceti]QHC56770.1 peptidoglycan-binding protein [Rathayibacter tanaceti]TCO33742.1 peptidoglycan hydrolase-like protein with peptidoglycan-binding domain [Rathayibacter tanaceti]